MRILTPVEGNLTLRSGVCVWMISSMVLSSSKVVLQEGRTHGFCRTNCPDFGRCAVHRRDRTYCQLDGVPHLLREIEFWAIVSLGDGWTWQCPPQAVQVSSLSPLDYSVWGLIKERSESDMRCWDALGAADRTRGSRRQLRWATRAIHNRAAGL